MVYVLYVPKNAGDSEAMQSNHKRSVTFSLKLLASLPLQCTLCRLILAGYESKSNKPYCDLIVAVTSVASSRRDVQNIAEQHQPLCKTKTTHNNNNNYSPSHHYTRHFPLRRPSVPPLSIAFTTPCLRNETSTPYSVCRSRLLSACATQAARTPLPMKYRGRLPPHFKIRHRRHRRKHDVYH